MSSRNGEGSATAGQGLRFCGRERQSFSTLQIGRGIAALLVVFFHISTAIFALDKYWAHDPLGGVFVFGRAGVVGFFVLSGFIMLHVHWGDMDRKERFWIYVKKRFVRVYPIYWLVLFATVPMYLTVSSFGKGFEQSPAVILSSIFLVGADPHITIIAVAWTLYHEVLFYMVFSLLLLNLRYGAVVMAIWLTGAAVMLVLQTPQACSTLSCLLPRFIFSPLHLLFAMGVATCWLFHKVRVSRPLLLGCLGLTLFALIGMEENYLQILADDARNLIYGLCSSMALLGFVSWERQGQLRISPAFRLLGDASYSIYLTHFMLLSLAAKVLWASGAGRLLPPLLSYALMAMTVVAAGSMFYVVVEKPLLRKLAFLTKS